MTQPIASPRPAPRARRERLITRALDGELLVYDLKANRASCLNAFAAQVWERCDGRHSAAAIARQIAEVRGTPVDERIVWLALDQLGRSRLLDEPVALLASVSGGRSRRELMRTLGLGAAAALPLVTSILVPSAADAQSCLPVGSSCVSNAQCCSNNCDGNCFP